jgi:hypothetical protein
MRQDEGWGTGKDGMFEEGWETGKQQRNVNETRWKGGGQEKTKCLERAGERKRDKKSK